MFKSIYKDIEYYIRTGNSLDKIIIVNVAVYILFFFIFLGFRIYNASVDPADAIALTSVSKYMALNADIVFDLKHPWVFISHMFFHERFFHILFNMLILYFLGRITGDLLGDMRVFPLYIMAGLASATAYLIATNLAGIPYGMALGASGAIMGIVAAAGMVAPDYEVHLILLGRVKLKYIVLVFILIDLFMVAGGGSNWGGRIGHLGGAAFGLTYIYLIREKGVDLARPIVDLVDRLQNSSKSKKAKESFKAKVVYNKAGIRKPVKKQYSGNIDSDVDLQERVDRILEKIKAQGYDKLTAEEKETLFIASKKDN